MKAMRLICLAVAATVATPAAAQFSDSYNFLKAVRDADAAKAQDFMERPGSRIIDTRDQTTGDTALHIVTKRRDVPWINFLANAGANLNVRDSQGMTPMAIAASLAFPDGIRVLAMRKADVNLPNSRGETPLILAIHRGDLATVRALVDVGADPEIKDMIAGRSARDYARQDRRMEPILKTLDSVRPKAKTGTIGPF
jgi:ankyrin repeat protein